MYSDVMGAVRLAPYGPLYLRLATGAERALAIDPSLTLVVKRH